MLCHEDAQSIVPELVVYHLQGAPPTTPQSHLLAGHGGPGAAAFVNENLLNTLLSHEKFDTDLKTALSEPLDLPHRLQASL